MNVDRGDNMLQLMVGTTHTFNQPLNIVLNGEVVEIDKILPLCMAKFDLKLEDDSIKVFVGDAEEEDKKCLIKRILYIGDLNNYVQDRTLIIRPSREYIFNYCTKQVDDYKAKTGLEHIDDLQMDLILKVADALIQNGMLQLSENELANYNKLKNQWQNTTSVTLETNTYQIDYSLDGDGVTGPKGLKALAREYESLYKTLLEQYGYEF